MTTDRCQARIREMIYYYLKIDQETDVPSCDNVSGTVMELWKDPIERGPGPSLEDVVFDWVGGRKSEWNAVLISLLAEKVKAEAQSKWKHLPPYEQFYWEESIWSKFRNLCFRWNRAQCRRKRDGRFESDQEASSRLIAQQKKERKLARMNTRRHSVNVQYLCTSFLI